MGLGRTQLRWVGPASSKRAGVDICVTHPRCVLLRVVLLVHMYTVSFSTDAYSVKSRPEYVVAVSSATENTIPLKDFSRAEKD